MNWPGISSLLLTPLLIMVVKLTAILGISWIAVSALSRKSAALRHRIWAAGVVCILVLPVLAILAPMQYSVPIGGAVVNWVSRVGVAPATSLAVSVPTTSGRARTTSNTTIADALIAIWGLAFFCLASRLAAGLWRLCQIAANATSVSDPEWASLAANLSQSLGIRCRVRILLYSSRTIVPVTWGVFRPRVVLPSKAMQWSPERRRMVLTHELAHVVRHDWLLQMCAAFMCCAYWFHPLTWIAARKLRQESERACDDAVLNTAVPAADYAKELLDLIQNVGTSSRASAAALAIARPSNFERRLEAMLGTSVNRSNLSKKSTLLVSVVAVCLLIPLAAFRLPAQRISNGAPRGWFLAGSKPDNYLTGIEREVIHVYQGHPSAYLKGKPSATEGFGTLMQSFSAARYVGRRVRFSASVKSEGVNDWAGLWMRVDQDSKAVAFDNMQNRPIKGTTGWQYYTVVLDVPQDSTSISFGVLLGKGGTVWLSAVNFETVGTDVPTTDTPMRSATAEGPTNLSFDQ